MRYRCVCVCAFRVTSGLTVVYNFGSDTSEYCAKHHTSRALSVSLALGSPRTAAPAQSTPLSGVIPRAIYVWSDSGIGEKIDSQAGKRGVYALRFSK